MSTPANDLTATIADIAANPQSMAAPDGRSATEQPLPDLIEADQYLAGKRLTTATNARGGQCSGWAGAARPARVIPPGAV